MKLERISNEASLVTPDVPVDLKDHAGCAAMVSSIAELVLLERLDMDKASFLLKCAEAASRIHGTIERERRAKFKEEIESKAESRMSKGAAALVELAKERS